MALGDRTIGIEVLLRHHHGGAGGVGRGEARIEARGLALRLGAAIGGVPGADRAVRAGLAPLHGPGAGAGSKARQEKKRRVERCACHDDDPGRRACTLSRQEYSRHASACLDQNQRQPDAGADNGPMSLLLVVRGLAGLGYAANRTSGLAISRAWARTGAAGSLEAGGFMTIANTGAEADRLAAARSAIAREVQIQGIKVVGSQTRMRRLDNGLGLPAGTTIELRPHGYHLLLQGLERALVPGEKVPVTLGFERAGSREIELMVKAYGPVGSDVLGSAAEAVTAGQPSPATHGPTARRERS